ncbi:MAG: hypothetical protein H5U06_06925 [Candidatus Aminicenantes bacterium]|nr:hypothetical protein [Candidatus Aminicenantes bacterium]
MKKKKLLLALIMAILVFFNLELAQEKLSGNLLLQYLASLDNYLKEERQNRSPIGVVDIHRWPEAWRKSQGGGTLWQHEKGREKIITLP